jgi:hypothetical protein
MTGRIQKNIGKLILSLVGVFCVAGGSGCDELLSGGYLSGWYPASNLYDPTNEIQGVIDYRQDVMDWSNDGWDEYIRQ